MSKYSKYLKELKSTTLFQNIEDKELINLLEIMKPEIVVRQAGTKGMPPIDIEKGIFCFILKGKDLGDLEERLDVFNMPKFGEPGMMMGEIPTLSKMNKSKGPRFKMKGPGPSGPSNLDYDLHLLLLSGEMLTKDYGKEYREAQGIMLRNFLGILSQKVTDIRKEKFAVMEEFEKELAPHRLNILCAGVSMRLVKKTAERWNKLHPELPAIVTPGGSVDLIRDVIDEVPCDLLVSADDKIISSMLMPNYVEGYRIWAGNKMVILGEDINDDNWEEKLTSDDATFKHHNPYGDPGGYRAVMSILLADSYKSGLTDKLMNHKGHMGMEKNPSIFAPMKESKYQFTYRSFAKGMGLKYSELPDIMNLSNPSLEKEYEKVSFEIDEENVVKASTIAHALAIPKSGLNKEAAKEFTRMFLENDMEEEGFITKEGIVGKDPLD